MMQVQLSASPCGSNQPLSLAENHQQRRGQPYG